MRITVRLSGYYEWEPVPGDVEVTAEDVKSGLVKPSTNGGFLMKVPRKLPKGEGTHTDVHLVEEHVWAKIIEVYARNGSGKITTRREAVAQIMSEHVMPHHAHRKHFEDFEVHDEHPSVSVHRRALVAGIDGNGKPFEEEKAVATHAEAFRARLGELSKLPNKRSGGTIIDPDDIDAIVAAYVEPTESEHHAEHLHKHFGTKKSKKGATA